MAKEITINAIESGRLNIEKLIRPEYKKVIIITSIEGGTGSGSSTVIAEHCMTKIGLPVEVIGFKGFEDDTRALQNTIEWFQDLKPVYGIQCICNSKFLKEAGSRPRAEKMANDELCKRISLSLGLVIKESEQNIDTSDTYKISNTTGYTDIHYIPVTEKIKSVEQFSSIVKDGINNTKSLEVENPGTARYGIIINIRQSSQDYIDYTYTSIKERYGFHPYELFQHIQYDESQEEFIGIVISGMKMPIDEVMNVFEKYKAESEALDTTDNFFDTIKALQGNAKDNQFNMLRGAAIQPSRLATPFTSNVNKKKLEGDY